MVLGQLSSFKCIRSDSNAGPSMQTEMFKNKSMLLYSHCPYRPRTQGLSSSCCDASDLRQLPSSQTVQNRPEMVLFQNSVIISNKNYNKKYSYWILIIGSDNNSFLFCLLRLITLNWIQYSFCFTWIILIWHDRLQQGSKAISFPKEFQNGFLADRK